MFLHGIQWKPWLTKFDILRDFFFSDFFHVLNLIFNLSFISMFLLYCITCHKILFNNFAPNSAWKEDSEGPDQTTFSQKCIDYRHMHQRYIFSYHSSNLINSINEKKYQNFKEAPSTSYIKSCFGVFIRFFCLSDDQDLITILDDM